jgi:hypothetical protein
MISSTVNGLPPSRILRTGTVNGRVAVTDPRIGTALRELDDLLATAVFVAPGSTGAGGYPGATGPGAASGAAAVKGATGGTKGAGASTASTTATGAAGGGGTGAAGGGGSGSSPVAGLDLQATLRVPLRPRRPGDTEEWEPDTLARVLDGKRDQVQTNPNPALVSLPAVIANDADLSQLSDDFDYVLESRWWDLPFNFRVVLGPEYPAIRAYLLVLGNRAKGITSARGLLSFISKNVDGAARLVDYGTISAARDWIKDENLKVEYRNDDDEVIRDLRAAGLQSSEDAFLPAVQAVVEGSLSDFGKSGTERIGKLVDGHRALFPPEFRSSLIEYLKRAPVKIIGTNVQSYIPLYVQQIAGGINFVDPAPTRGASDQDFAVDFFTEDKELIEISRSSVKAAAQLYYTMILGDELQVFDVVNFFTHKYLVARGFEISDPKLRRDLQMYVFSNQFPVTDPVSNAVRIVERTQPAERQMFYRQVFNYGGGQITEDVIVNDEFSRLWKVLMLESAKFLERIQVSPNPDTRVSRQNVMQAVEDLQYNLSIHCTGMATVMTPLIYDELSFVTRRILMHEDVRKQVAPSGGSWWKVVETLYEGMKHVRPRATALNNKARLGHSIIRAIAEYDPEPFEQDDNFFRFISNVEAFITTQSILQENLKDALKDREDEDLPQDEAPEHAGGGLPVLAGPVDRGPTTPPSDEWDF